MATVNFLYRSTKDKANLNLRLLFRKNDIDYVIGGVSKVEVTKEYWNKYHNSKRISDIETKNFQTEINNKLSDLENFILNQFENTIEVVNKEWLKNVINEYYNPTQNETIPTELVKYFDYFKARKKSENTESTEKKYNTVQQLLKRFETSTNKTILVKDVNEIFKKSFEDFCNKHQYSHNTIARALRSVKTICKHAQHNGIETSYQLDGLKAKYKKTDSIYLTFEDLNTIESIEPNKLTESLENAKDWLIISCYTGQRVSDFMNFTKEQIRIEDGKKLLEFTQKKTNKNMTIPVHKKVLEILEKRNGNFPKPISDQKYNAYIKKVCEIAELNEIVKGGKKTETELKDKEDVKQFRKEVGMFKKWELVTSHIGRRSFASNFYGTIPTTFLIYVTGHSTEKMFLNYIGKSNKDLALELTKYF
jgi:integrase